MTTRLRPLFSFVPSLLLALLYGALARFLFGSVLQGVSSPLSIAFIVIVPVVIGMLAVYFAPPDKRARWGPSLAIAVLAMFLGAVLAAVIVWEAAICVVMALPIMLLMAGAGGLLMWWLLDRRSSTEGMLALVAFAFIPFLFIPLENRFPVYDSFHTVENQIAINADAETVWQNIVRVERIREKERPFSILFSFFAAPKPLQADMVGEGVGGIRRGQFEGGLQFVETISAWQPAERIEWDITPANTGVMLAPWNAIGGKPFAVPRASYWIEPAGDHRVILHLGSEHRLSTRFNGYGALWTRWGMSEFQNYVLQIIKARAEAS